MAIIPYNNSSNGFNDISDLPPIFNLPPDMLMRICHDLAVKEIVCFASTSREFYFLSSINAISNPLWKSLFYHNYKDFDNSPEEIKKIANKLSFYKFYKCLTQVIHNTKNWQSIPKQSNYNSKIQSFFKTKEELWTLINEDPEDVSCIKVIGKEFLISCQWRGAITIWNLYTKQNLLELKTSQYFISHIKMVDRNTTLVFSAKDSKKITLLNFDTKEKQSLENKAGYNIQCFKIVDSENKQDDTKLIISGLSNRSKGMIEIWDPKTKEKFQMRLKCKYTPLRQQPASTNIVVRNFCQLLAGPQGVVPKKTDQK